MKKTFSLHDPTFSRYVGTLDFYTREGSTNYSPKRKLTDQRVSVEQVSPVPEGSF